MRPQASAHAELYATVFITGAAVMVLEILGTRMIAPVFGVNLFVWTALLAVTLCSLALGYYLGGGLADSRPDRRLLGVVVVVAGAMVALALPLRRPILYMAEGLGPRVGPLVGATVLVGPCLFVLGMVGPIVVRLVTDDLRTTGRRVGRVYAVSTAGSLVGTVATGFLLVPAFETNQILLGTALLVTLVGAIPLLLRRRPSALLALLVPALVTMMAGSQAELPAGLHVVARSQSPYSLLEVIDDKNQGVRFMRADHSVIGANWLASNTSAFSFLHVLESLHFMRPNVTNLLQIGLGTGALPMALQRFAIKSDVVEIDPGVVALARDHFSFATKGHIFIEDARTFLRRVPGQKYDFVVHDTFTGGTTPEHLLSVEVLGNIRAVMQPGGVLALNFLGYQRGPRADASRAIQRTLRATFTNVRAFRDISPDKQPDALSNITFFASDGPIDPSIPGTASFENEACERALRSFSQWEILKEPSAGPVITDDRNPLARLQLTIASDHFDLMKQLLPIEVWLN